MRTTKYILLIILSLLSHFCIASDVSWQKQAIEQTRLNIILFINIAIFAVVLVLTLWQLVKTKRVNQHHYEQSVLDPLTQLFNRHGFHQSVDRLDNKSGFLLIADIDNFKSINDRFGHNIGDKVLHRVAKTLKQQVRDSDIVARYGGEEFVIFFPSQDSNQLKMISQRLICSVSALDFSDLNENLKQVTISVGLDKGSVEANHFELLYEKADTLLYKAKSSGKNQFIMGHLESASV
ncbi:MULTISPECIES: GGDEF domain-containing protein [Pseudoalteromonas]|uniref:GGDEF domain-containing protein n=1 Tax=Pseudoalteromonas TaxID=53246 RepID=UPI000E81E1A3|nr:MULTISPECIES: GGDEF domain-containing protein [Pseudoalteromonas]MDI4652933.1 GGDEF domain-containing protein [Pseudoalteromonas shioyasakiensis]NUJ38921.1 GGDEF domain-containing protein [Pseudoalteromonas sp. 0303]HAU06113.1 hypothetical protein [Pseudoalteromonas shioyasakiensis]